MCDAFCYDFAEDICELESLYFIQICLPGRRSFQQHHTSIHNNMDFMVQNILSKFVTYSYFQRTERHLHSTRSFISVHRSPPLDPKLSEVNPVRPIDPYLPMHRWEHSSEMYIKTNGM